MGIFRTLRGAADIGSLTITANHAERYASDDAYKSLALSLGKQVLQGSCDPILAEAALNDHLAAEQEDFINTKKAERGAKALERFVLNGFIDPLLAEDVLDRGFSALTVRSAFEQIGGPDADIDRSA